MKITIEFIGGNKDGCRYTGDTDHGPSFNNSQTEEFEAYSFYFLSDNGRVGARFRGITDYALHLVKTIGPEEAIKREGIFLPEMYIVTERIVVDGDVLVRATFIPGQID
jgi:hypothetical protein